MTTDSDASNSSGSSLPNMSDEEWEYTFDPMFDLEERWGIDTTEAEEFLELVGYFDTERYREVAEVFDPTPQEEAEARQEKRNQRGR